MAKEINTLLKVYQIYFNESSFNSCFKEFDWWIPYDNTGKLNCFFENQVIHNLIEGKKHLESEYFAVFSHDISKEITFKENGKPFNPESLLICLESGHDVYSFQKRRHNENIIFQSERYHPGIVDMTSKILHKLGLLIPKKLNKIVLFNHFVAKSEIYERYFNEMLRPAMAVMKQMPELHANAGYNKYHPDFTSQLGYNHYPYHPFILERLMSVWLELNKEITFKHIF